VKPAGSITTVGLALAISSSQLGCLAVPASPDVECKVTADCDTDHGEVCDEGVCWGNPPPGPFAALITPPTERKREIVSRELTLEAIPADGYFGDIALQEAVTFSGQIVCPNECSESTLGATIVVTRPSSFVGGPTFRQVFTSDPTTGTFQLALPRVQPGEPPYTITATPDGRDLPGTNTETIAELVPPLHIQLALDNSQAGKTLDLGGESPLTTITGSIVDLQDNPATNYRVVALGRWESGAPLTEVSTVDFIGQTGGNTFALRLSEGVLGSVEVVAQPFGPVLQPTLHTTVNPASALVPHKLVIPNIGTGESVATIIVEGTATNGEVTGVLGSHVTISGSVAVTTTSTTATFTAEGDTDASGMVNLKVPGGDLASSYKVSVTPAANASLGVMFAQHVAVPGMTKLKLPNRLAITGTLRDAAGDPLAGVQVTAHPSLRFEWSLAAAPQAFLTAVPAASTVTLDTGEFVLYVDPFLDDGEVDTWGFYDLEFVPTAGSDAPSWSQLEVEIPRDTTVTQLSVGTSVLPEAAHVHGRIVDPFGELVEDAELKLFRIADPVVFASFCSQLQNPPASCPVPATQLGRGVSDSFGIARLTLPR